jgi:tyrosine-protein phosphatase
MSPIKTSFDNPWPTGYDLDDEPSAPAPQAINLSAPPKSARASKFHVPDLKSEGISRSYGKSSELGVPTLSRDTQHNDRYEPPEIASPAATHFPKDIFEGTDDPLDDELKSPRASEFHMTPLKPRIADEDPFGLTSPTRADFNPFDRPSIATVKDAESGDRPPSFQAILPPAHQTFSGFASLDGTAQTQSFFQSPAPMIIPTTKHYQGAEPRIDSLSNSPETQVTAPANAYASIRATFPKAPDTPQTPSHAFLSTPAKAIKTRFSSPNMREQRELHKLQTEIQSKMPKPQVAQHAADDIDALMSPRAEEFTRNPFHFELESTGDDVSSASSNETIKDTRSGHTWEEPIARQWTPEKATVDPRSPVQTGSNPIVRNIWDVL